MPSVAFLKNENNTNFKQAIRLSDSFIRHFGEPISQIVTSIRYFEQSIKKAKTSLINVFAFLIELIVFYTVL